MADRFSSDDEALSQALQSADSPEEAFRVVFARYHRPLLSFFNGRGFSRETARDLSQEVFLRVYRAREGFRGDAPFGAWIFKIAAHLAANEVRHRRADKRSAQEVSLDREDAAEAVDGLTAEAPVALRSAVARQKLDWLRTARADLPPRMRRTFDLHLEGFDTADIARLMKTTRSTVKVQIHQARKRLEASLAERFGDDPNGVAVVDATSGRPDGGTS